MVQKASFIASRSKASRHPWPWRQLTRSISNVAAGKQRHRPFPSPSMVSQAHPRRDRPGGDPQSLAGPCGQHPASVSAGTARLDNFLRFLVDTTIHDPSRLAPRSSRIFPTATSVVPTCARRFSANWESSMALSATDFMGPEVGRQELAASSPPASSSDRRRMWSWKTGQCGTTGPNAGKSGRGLEPQKLTDPVGKRFLGTDHPLATSDWGPDLEAHTRCEWQAVQRHAERTPIFRQGGLGDCASGAARWGESSCSHALGGDFRACSSSMATAPTERALTRWRGRRCHRGFGPCRLTCMAGSCSTAPVRWPGCYQRPVGRPGR